MRVFLILTSALIGMSYRCNAQTPADDVAAQSRIQGYRCDQTVTAKRNVRRSKPASAVWILLDPTMAAHVTKLKEKL